MNGKKEENILVWSIKNNQNIKTDGYTVDYVIRDKKKKEVAKEKFGGVTFPPRAEMPLTIQLPKKLADDEYQINLTLTDKAGKKREMQGEYRWDKDKKNLVITKEAKEKSSNNIFVVLGIIIFVVLASGGAGWWYWKQHHQMEVDKKKKPKRKLKRVGQNKEKKESP